MSRRAKKVSRDIFNQMILPLQIEQQDIKNAADEIAKRKLQKQRVRHGSTLNPNVCMKLKILGSVEDVTAAIRQAECAVNTSNTKIEDLTNSVSNGDLQAKDRSAIIGDLKLARKKHNRLCVQLKIAKRNKDEFDRLTELRFYLELNATLGRATPSDPLNDKQLAFVVGHKLLTDPDDRRAIPFSKKQGQDQSYFDYAIQVAHEYVTQRQKESERVRERRHQVLQHQKAASATPSSRHQGQMSAVPAPVTGLGRPMAAASLLAARSGPALQRSRVSARSAQQDAKNKFNHSVSARVLRLCRYITMRLYEGAGSGSTHDRDIKLKSALEILLHSIGAKSALTDRENPQYNKMMAALSQSYGCFSLLRCFKNDDVSRLHRAVIGRVPGSGSCQDDIASILQNKGERARLSELAPGVQQRISELLGNEALFVIVDRDTQHGFGRKPVDQYSYRLQQALTDRGQCLLNQGVKHPVVSSTK